MVRKHEEEIFSEVLNSRTITEDNSKTITEGNSKNRAEMIKERAFFVATTCTCHGVLNLFYVI